MRSLPPPAHSCAAYPSPAHAVLVSWEPPEETLCTLSKYEIQVYDSEGAPYGEPIVKKLMEFDANNDGIVSYSEVRVVSLLLSIVSKYPA